MRLLPFVLVVVGCGRFGFDAVGVTDASDADAPVLPIGPFGPPSVMVINSGTVDVDPSMTADGLLLFFTSLRGGGLDIYSSSRASVDGAWEPPTVVGLGTISTTAVEQDAVISADGLTLYFTRADDIYQATRTTRTGVFGMPSAIADLNSPDVDVVGSVTYDGLALMMHSTRSGRPDHDIYISTRLDASSPWSTPQPVSGMVNSATSNESDSFLWGDRLTLFFDSNRDGDYNVFVATRATPDEPFGAPVPLAEINTADEEADTWLSVDGRTIMFVRGPNLLGNLDIYEARR
jgi:hypothetical protein